MAPSLRDLKFAWDYFVRGRYRGHQSAEGTGWVEPPSLSAELWFGSLLVADLHQLFPHQGTWFAEYELKIAANRGPQEDQLLAYISFCEEFHRQIDEGRDHDFDEFERFTPVQNCESWVAKLPSGRFVPMEGIMWFADGGTTWRHPETKPSTEAAANEFWLANAPSKKSQAEQDGGGQPATRAESN
jgi:hypothetical protein